jgi:hypothetical protein
LAKLTGLLFSREPDSGASDSFICTAFFHFVALKRLQRNNVALMRQSTTARGYGSRYQTLRKQVAKLVASGNAVCWRCGRPILPWMQWDLGHDGFERTIYRGPEHQ